MSTRQTQTQSQGDDLREIQRQNTITAQILENFLERRLYPNKRPTHRLPTLDEILPKAVRSVTTRAPNATSRHPFDKVPEPTDDDDDDQFGSSEDGEDYRDPESLQSVESEHVDSYLDEGVAYRNEGRSHNLLPISMNISQCGVGLLVSQCFDRRSINYISLTLTMIELIGIRLSIQIENDQLWPKRGSSPRLWFWVW